MLQILLNDFYQNANVMLIFNIYELRLVHTTLLHIKISSTMWYTSKYNVFFNSSVSKWRMIPILYVGMTTVYFQI